MTRATWTNSKHKPATPHLYILTMYTPAEPHHVFEIAIATVKEYCVRMTYCCCPIVTVQPEDDFDIEKGIINPLQSRSEYISLADDPIESWFMTSATRRANIIANRPSGFILRLNQS